MKTAVLSDVHGNYYALQSVLEATSRLGANKIISLGDVVGYGPKPVECLQTIFNQADVKLMGNHDRALFNEEARSPMDKVPKALIYWTIKKLQEQTSDQNTPSLIDRIQKEFQMHHYDGKFMYVHACPGITEFVWMHKYVYRDDVASREFALNSMQYRMLPYVGAEINICFLGHTHQPMVSARSKSTGEDRLEIPSFSGDFSAIETKIAAPLSIGEKEWLVVNVGSVGQPRDDDPRACFAIVDDEKIQWVRVPYDVQSMVKELQSLADKIRDEARKNIIHLTKWDIEFLLAERYYAGQ